jgi:PKD repeat protein
MIYTNPAPTWTDPANQDRITDNVWIARRDRRGIFNMAVETGYPQSPPSGTEWAYGTAASRESLIFQPWRDWHGGSPSNTVGKDAVLHLIESDVYLDITFLSWTSGGAGGGFSYERATEGTAGEKIWSGPKTTFTKDDFADWTDPANQDRITDDVWITRQDSRGLFNRAKEPSDLPSPPSGTEWAFGSAADWASLEFDSWESWHGGKPPGTVGKDAVLRLVREDVYIDIKFLSWGSGKAGGGFSYERATEGTPGEKVWTGTKTTFTKDGFADWTDPANQDRVTDDVWLTRQDSQGLFNMAREPSYTPSPPSGTEWAYGSAADWATLEFSSWESWHGGNPRGVLDEDAVLHLIEDDIYLDIVFTGWAGGGGGGFSYVRGANALPMITAVPTADPGLAQIGEDVVFGVAATDEDGDPLTFSWDFGDGSTGTGASPAHQYAAAGMYTVTVTVSDGLEDAIETVDLIVANSLPITKLKGKLDFKKPDRDGFLLKGDLELPQEFVPDGVGFQVDVGGAPAEFTLDAKGKAKTETGVVKLKYSKKKGLWSFRVKLKKSDFADAWADEGLVNETKTDPVDIRSTVTVGDETFIETETYTYKGKAGKSGKVN